MGKCRTIEIGERFGRLEVMSCSFRPHHFVCRCDCGKESNVLKYNLLNGVSTQCCDCNRYTKKPKKDYLRKRFGHWKVLSYLGRGRWEIRCDCGKKKETSTYAITAMKSNLNWSCAKCAQAYRIDRERLVLIKAGLTAGLNQPAIARLLNLTSERIGQIIKVYLK